MCYWHVFQYKSFLFFLFSNLKEYELMLQPVRGLLAVGLFAVGQFAVKKNVSFD